MDRVLTYTWKMVVFKKTITKGKNMSALTLSLEDALGGSIRILPLFDKTETDGIICREIGPEYSRRYLAVGAGCEFSYRSHIWQTPEDLKSCLIPKACHDLLEKPQSVGHILAVAARNIFPHPLALMNVRWLQGGFSANMCCQMCKIKAREEKHNLEEVHLPKALNIAFTLTWDGLTTYAVCDDHFKKNNGEIMDTPYWL